MTIWEVWAVLEEAYVAIFNTDEEAISRPWLKACSLKDPSEKRNHIEKELRVIDLQEAWIKAFGGDSIQRARKTMKHMMLFIVFGSHMAYPENLFDNGDLEEFFEKHPVTRDRLNAFVVCFGETADWQKIKSRMSKILR